MITVDRHGGSNHFMRPDRVYKTGVLSPMQGYQPNQDVQAVAAEFTDFPTNLQVTALSGATGAGFFQRLALRWNAWRAQRKAAGHLFGPGHQGGIEPGMARDMTGKLEMLATMMAQNLPQNVREQQVRYSIDNWNHQRWPR